MVQFASRMDLLKGSEIRELLKLTAQPDIISFAGGMPAPELFPVEQMMEASRAVLEENGRVALQYSSTEGYPKLRQQIADRMLAKNNIHTDADHILVTSGSQQGLDFSARVFLDPGDVVLLEAGDAVPADGRILESASMKIEEAALTGESVPVSKFTEPLTGEQVSLGDRKNMAYMGSTQFKAFEKCEAAALAELKGEYHPPSSTALLVGGYIDAWFSGELPLYQAQHPEIFKRDGTLKAEYLRATEVVVRMQSDELYMLLMSGRKQVIRTGEIAGVPFKIKIDSLLDGDTCKAIVQRFPNTAAALGFCDGAIVDQKAMKDMADVWSAEDHCKIPFIEFYGYDIQGAIYQAIEGNMLPFVLAVGTKEESPDLEALYIADEDLAAKLAEVEDRAPRYQAIKEGRIQPTRCEHCDYCKATKHLTAILNYKELAADAWE